MAARSSTNVHRFVMGKTWFSESRRGKRRQKDRLKIDTMDQVEKRAREIVIAPVVSERTTNIYKAVRVCMQGKFSLCGSNSRNLFSFLQSSSNAQK